MNKQLTLPEDHVIEVAVPRISGLPPANTKPVDAGEPGFAESFGAFLVQDGAIDGLVLDRAHRATQATAERFDQVLTKLGLLSETDLAVEYSKYLSIPLYCRPRYPPSRFSATHSAPTLSAATR
jgi:hypothetical protein